MEVFSNIAAIAIRNWQLTHELAVQVEHLEHSNKFKTEILEIASHELRTPVTIIRDALSMVPEDETSEYIHYAKMASARQVILVNNILSSSMIESDSFKIDKNFFNLDELITKIVQELQLFLRDKKVRILLELKSNMMVLADEYKISQVVYNLVYNAIKFTNKGNITIASSVRDGMVGVSVKDTGVGISPKLLSHLFDKYQNRDLKSPKRIFGTGLGLYLAKYIIESHGGTMQAESTYQKGSDFRFTLPLK